VSCYALRMFQQPSVLQISGDTCSSKRVAADLCRLSDLPRATLANRLMPDKLLAPWMVRE